MIKYILLFIFIVLAMLGLAELLHGVRLHFITPKKRSNNYSIVFLDDDFAEQQLNYIIEQFLWLGSTFTDKIIAVYTDLNNENIQTCKKLAEKYNIIYCHINELNSVVSSLNK